MPADALTRLTALLAAGPWPIEGGLASELEARGHRLDDHLWSARLLRDDPAAVRDAHRAYLDAGARVVISASYQASREGFAAAGLDAEEADRLLTLSVRLAREAVEGAGGGGLVAASVGPYGAIAHDGGEYRGRYGIPRVELVDFHRRRLDVLAAAGPDLFAVETIPDADEAAVLAEVLADHPDIPAWMTFSCGDDRHVCAGQPIEEAVAAATTAASVLAVGVNRTPPEHLTGLLTAAAAATDRPLVAYPNAGRGWDAGTGTWTGEGVDVLPAPVVRTWVETGAALVGGCCGLGPRAVADLDAVLAPLRAG